MALSVNGGFGSKGGGSNPNLLDNGWFTVNQRGATTVASIDYGADRWLRNRGGVTFGDGYVDFSYSSNYLGAIQQVFEKDLPHGTYTGSLMLDDGTIYSGTINYTGNSPNTFFTNSKIELDLFKTTKTYVVLYGMGTETVRVKAVKVERGSVSTLALDSAPNYATELLKCQRYYYKFDTIGASGIAYSNTTLRVDIKLPVPMRTTPTATITNSGAYKGGSWLSTTTALYVLNESHDIVSFTVTGSGFTTGYAYPVKGDYSLSADL